MAETLLTKIKRSDNFPYVVQLSVTNNKGYISLNTEDWTPQMFYELPAIKFDIYTEQNGIMSKYNPVSYTIDTYTGVIDITKTCIPLKNIPENCYVYIYPIFDKTAIMARNALVENGIEDGDIWTSQTDTFDLELAYLEGHDDVYPITTITGTSPLSFKSLGADLSAWTVYGNLTQTGTPTPDSPITPQETGDRTENLFYPSATQSSGSTLNIRQTEGVSEVVLNKSVSASDTSANVTIDITLQAGTYKISVDGLNVLSASYDRCFLRDTDNNVIVNDIQTNSPKTFTISETVKLNRLTIVADAESVYTNTTVRIMLNTGETALPYEPFGYRIPVTANGTTYPVYLQEPIRKISDYADSASATGTSGTMTRRIKKLVLTGEEANWIDVSSGNTKYFRLTLGAVGNRVPDLMASTHFVNAEIRTATTTVGCCMLASSSQGYDFVAIRPDNVSTTSLSDFKTYLQQQYSAGTPVTVWYVLETPVTETFNVPTIATAKGENTLTVGTTLPPSQISITGNIKEV